MGSPLNLGRHEKGPVAELKNSAAGFLVTKEGRIMEIAMKFAGTSRKRV